MRYRFVSSVLDVSANASSTSTAEADCGYSQWIDCSNTLMHPNGVSIAHYWTNINYFYCNSQHGQVDENSNVHDTETDVETVTTKDTNASVSLNSPQIEVEIQIATNVVAIVVIEKEGIFHHLCEDRFFDRVPCVLVTGCGEFLFVCLFACYFFLVNRVIDMQCLLSFVSHFIVLLCCRLSGSCHSSFGQSIVFPRTCKLRFIFQNQC